MKTLAFSGGRENSRTLNMLNLSISFLQMSFQRCARTDKGVSAARQVVSLKMSVLSVLFYLVLKI